MGLRRRVLEHIDGHNGEVERHTRIYPRNDVGRGVEVDRKLVAAGLLELRAEIVIQQSGEGATRDDPELGRFRGRYRRQRQT